MPTYQYACKDCDNAFETVQSFSDASLTECPQCHGRLRKVFNSVGVVFKGSGFYRTDSRGESGSSSISSKPKESAESTASESSSSSSDSSSSNASTKSDTSTKKSEPAAAAAS